MPRRVCAAQPMVAYAVTVATLILLVALLWQTPSAAQETHLGVTSCAGSTCHGAASTRKKTGVVQNEYLIWERYDKHARAFEMLQGSLGRRIAANLGLAAADTAPACLSCHTDNVPPSLRGVQFQISDGVGCEACHGGSQKWLGPHASGRIGHAELVQQYGLFPTDAPQSRASLCQSCHVGDAAHPIDHEMMGAGHPRLAYELQTFTHIQPMHYVIDDKYRARKRVPPGVQVWAVGQARALQALADGIATRNGAEGAFPELIFFDCQSCHHSTATLRWQKRAAVGLPPGLPHLNDANAVMLQGLPVTIAPDIARALQKDVRALHVAMSEGCCNRAAIARRIATQAAALAGAYAGHDFTQADMRSILGSLAGLARRGDASDYAVAEQATMAFAAIIDSLQAAQAVDAPQFAALRAGLERCYAATAVPDRYDPAVFAAAAQAVAAALQVA